jgi:hypothetical protein
MKRNYWTAEQDQYMRDHYTETPNRDIGKAIKRSPAAVQSRAWFLKLVKSEFFFNSLHPTRYRKGHISDRKGKPMSTEQYEKCFPTMIKKGSTPPNKMPVGTIRKNYTHRGNYIYLLIKIAEPDKWASLHRHQWEQEHGPIPEKMNIVFKDGNTLNCEVANLELITNQEKMARNTIHNQYPRELIKTIQALGVLKRKIKNHG